MVFTHTTNLPQIPIIGWMLLMDSHDNLHSGMQMEWQTSLDKLEQYSLADINWKKKMGLDSATSNLF